MKLKAEIKRNPKTLAALRKRVRNINADQSYVKVGHLGGATRNDGLTNATVGVIQEFGSPENNIPARPWLRPPVANFRPQFNQMIAEALRAELRGEPSLHKTLGLIGAKAVAEIKKYVTAGDPIPPPNAPSTLARKTAKSKRGATKAPRTLVDTGQMVNGVTFAVVKGNTQKGTRK